MKDEPLTACEQCGGKVKRLIGAGAGFILKGNGFYGTDYRSESYKAAAKQDTSASSPSPSTEAKSTSETKAPSPPKTESNSK